MDGAKEMHTVKNQIRRKGDANTSRPVFTQSSTHEGRGIQLRGQSSRGACNKSDEAKFPEQCKPWLKKHSLLIQAGSSLMPFLKGKGGCVQQQIEEEMGVKIIFPSSRNEDNITIEGSSIDSLSKASKKIQAIIDEAVKSPAIDYSHFVSLPLAIYPGLVDMLVNFQESILGKTDPNHQGESTAELGIEKSIFINPKTFHLTVLMLKLWNKERIDAAAEVLQGISSEVIDALDGRPVSIRLKGLECMRGSFEKARVLYAAVEEIGGEGRLIRACEVIISAFVAAGLVTDKDAQNKLKLHATLMNAKHRKRTKGKRWVDSFDARGIVAQYGSKDWGKYLIREAHLSRRFVYDKNGYYHCCCSIPFPKNRCCSIPFP